MHQYISAFFQYCTALHRAVQNRERRIFLGPGGVEDEAALAPCRFDALALKSGTYLYTLRTEGFTSARIMVLLK